MMPHPTKFSVLSLLFSVFFILTSCTKDSDILKDAVLEDPLVTVDEQNAESDSADNPDADTAIIEEGFESRTTTFYPVADAYVDSENGELFNQEIIRLSEGQRESFMLFDLSPINDIGGYITSAKLQFTVVGDEGNGTITAYKAAAGEWKEDSTEKNAMPETDVALGSIVKEYKMNAAQEVALSAADLTTERTTLILKHDTGDDLALASKEHTSKIGPKLIITYNAPLDAKAVVTVKEAVTLTSQGSGTTAAIINNKPIAIADANVTSGGVPLTVNFTGSNSMDDNKVVKYIWDFRDGTPKSFVANPSHTFKTAGIYKVILIVKDAAGLGDIDPVFITVGGATNEAPKAVAKANPTQGLAPLQVAFNAESSTDDRGIVKYKWNLGNNEITTDKNPTKTFNTPGVYNVTLTVIDENFLLHTDTVTITVEGAPSGGGDTGDGGSDAGGGGDSGDAGGASPIPAGAVKASSFGFKAGDATNAFNAAINSNASVIVINKQSSDWIIGPSKFWNTKNKTIIFEPGVVVRAKKGAFPKTNSSLLNFYHPENVVIEGYGATLQMNKSEYTTGEWRHALMIDGGRNVTVKGLTTKDSGGDGVNIQPGDRKYSENITIEDVFSTNNRRNALTIISGKNVWVKNCEFSYSNGTKPESGIHLEPEESDEQLTNINFENCKIHHNDGTGFSIGTSHLNSSSTPISVNVKNSNFTMNAVAPNEGRVPTEIFANSGKYGNPVKGLATFSGLTFNGTKSRVFLTKKPDYAFKVIFNNCTANNVIQDGNVSPIDLQSAPAENSSLGGIEFNNFYIQYTKNKSFMSVAGPKGFPLKNITGTFTIKEPNDKPISYVYGISPSSGENYKVDVEHIN